MLEIEVDNFACGGGGVVTVDRDPSVTPFMIGCKLATDFNTLMRKGATLWPGIGHG